MQNANPQSTRSLPALKRSAFSLIELIVVIGMISALAALLLPSLASARAQALSVTCASNQRQIGLGVLGYTEDYDGLLPISQYYDKARNALVAWDTITSFGPGGCVEPGLIWAYTAANEVQQCPAYRGPSMTVADPYTGYNYNTTYLGRGENEGAYLSMGCSPANVAHVTHTATTAMIGDGGWKAGANKFMRAPLDGGAAEGTVHAGAQAFRHRGSTIVTYVDGHAAPTQGKFRKPDAQPYNEAILGWPDNGFLSDDDSAYAHR